MSRIVHGPNPEVQDWMASAGGSRRGAGGKIFQTGKVDGTFSKVEVEQAAEKARQEGRLQGVQETERKLAQPLNAALQNLEGILDEISRFRRELFKEAEVEAIELVRFLSKRVVAKELALAPDLLKELVEKGLEVVEREKQISLHFNPSDMKIFQVAKPDFLQKLGGANELRFNVDSNISSGTALIKTESVQVDINVETMVDHLLEQVKQTKVSDREVNDDGEKA